MPSPFEGPHVSIKKPAMAEFGMDFGRNIALGIPLQSDRTYFYVRFDAGFELQVGMTETGPITLTIPAGINALLIVDPLDPFFFFSGGILTPESEDERSDDTDPDDGGDGVDNPGDGEPGTGGGMTGFGMSSQSLILTQPGTHLTGEMTVPSQFNADASAAIVAEGQRVSTELGALYDSYQQATANYQFELSLRGMRSLIPGLCDAVVSILNQAQTTAHQRIDQQWPWYLSGKSGAKADVSWQLSTYRSRFTTLKSRAQTADSASVRAALASAIDAVIASQVVRITVPHVGTVYTGDVLTATQEESLRTAKSAIAAIPGASNATISARTIWEQAPKRETLVATADAITAGVAGAAPRIVRLGFDQAFGYPGLTLLAVVEQQGQTSTIAFAFDPAHPAEIGRMIGLSLAAGL